MSRLAVQAAGGGWGAALAGVMLRGLFSSQNGYLLLARLTLLLAVFLFASRVGVPGAAPVSTPDRQPRGAPRCSASSRPHRRPCP